MIDRTALRLTIARGAFNDSVRIRTWKKLAAQIHFNLDLLLSIVTLRDRAKSKGSLLQQTYGIILERMNTGLSLGAALEGLVPTEEVLLISGGQESGQLSQTLPLCVELIEAKREILRSLAQALAYPLLLFSMLVILVVTLSVHVMPNISMLVDPSRLTGAAALMHGLSAWVASPVGACAGLFAVTIIFASLVSLPLWTGPLRLRVEYLPPWSFYRLVIGSVWLFTVATLMKGGMQLNHILESQLKTPGLSPWLRERVQAVHEEVALGKGLGEALADSGMRFPDEELVEDLCMYSKLPRFHEHLHAMAQSWLHDGVATITRQAQILNGLCLGGIIALLCGVALAISSLQQQLSTGSGF